MKSEFSKVGLVLRGLAMGVAEVIPGVSGGTIAFITGIYENLIDTIKSIGPEAYQGYKDDGFSGIWNAVNGNFLLWLLVGMAGGLVSGVLGVSYLMENFPEPLWAFFFGLIASSAIYMARQIDGWDPKKFLALITGAVVAYGITTLSPAEGSLNPLYVYLSGAIAISALMLPGISGSFILLIMGMYTLIIPLVKNILENLDVNGLVTIGIFGLGCLTGLVIFSRLLSWLFKSYRESTLALLTGFLIGALNKVWPWRNITSVLDKESGDIIETRTNDDFSLLNMDNKKVLTEMNVWADNYWGDDMLVVCLVTFIIGFVLVFLLERVNTSK